jgi:hypothetical protein
MNGSDRAKVISGTVRSAVVHNTPWTRSSMKRLMQPGS